MTLVEIAIAVALLGLVAAGAIATLVSLNKNAVSTRVMSSVREIVQRNIEAATGVPFTASTEPAILQTTNGPVAWDDSGGTNPVQIYSSRDGKLTITGDLKRTVTKESNPASADIRRINFRLAYKMFGRDLSYEMTTIRAMDR